jgi:hypothetical protein
MKTKISLAVLALCMGLSAPVLANDEHHPEKAQGGQATSAEKRASKPAGEGIKALQANVDKMQKQVQQIAKAKNDKERDRLLEEHMKTMRDSMMTAKGMHADMDGCPMMEDMMGGKGGKGGMGGMSWGGGASSGKSSGASDDRMDRMEKRMDMMEQMMKGSGSGGGMSGMERR